MKVCKGCETVKPLTDFYRNTQMADGHLSWCKPCFMARHRDAKSRRQRLLLAYIQQVKVSRGCADCGYDANPVALDFDHLPGFEKRFRIATMAAGNSRELIDAEIAKCDVVCANCHRIRTAQRREADAS